MSEGLARHRKLMGAILLIAAFLFLYLFLQRADTRQLLIPEYRFAPEQTDLRLAVQGLQDRDTWLSLQPDSDGYLRSPSGNSMMVIRFRLPYGEYSAAIQRWFSISLTNLVHSYALYRDGVLHAVGGQPGPGYYPDPDSALMVFAGSLLQNARDEEYHLILYSDSEHFRAPLIHIIRDRQEFLVQSILNFANAQLYVYFALVNLLVCLYYGIHFRQPGGRREDLDFAIFNGLMGLYFLRIGAVPLVGNSLLLQAASKALLLPAGITLLVFIHRYLGGRTGRTTAAILGTLSLLLFLLFSIVPGSYYQAEIMFRIVLLPVLLMIVVFLLMISRAYIRGARESASLLAGSLFGFTLILHDVLYMLGGHYPRIWLQGIGIFIFSLVIFADLARRNVRVRLELAEHYSSIERKVTERTRELAESNCRLKEAGEAKSRFLATMSHEMRTPLNIIIGHGEHLRTMAEKGSLQGEQAVRLADYLLHESRRLTLLINQVLDLSRIEKGMLSLECLPFSPGQVFDSCAAALVTLVESKGLEYYTEFDPDIPDSVMGDAFRLEQIILNLISNAVKFTHDGFVRLSMMRYGEEIDGTLGLRIAVEDSGIGMDDEQQTQIFREFYQGDPSITRLYGGSGLGLSIVRQLTGIMGGRLNLASSPGRGSRFEIYIRLPLAQGCPDPGEGSRRIAARTVPDLKDYRLLLVDDYPPNIEVLTLYLAASGAELTRAYGGEQTIELCRSTSFHAILMDIHMPVMDGMETALRLRNERLLENTVLIGVSADTSLLRNPGFIDAGFFRMLSKPLEKGQLYSLLEETLPARRQEGNGVPGKSGPSMREEPEEAMIKDILLRGFLDHGRDDLRGLRHSLSLDDASGVHRASHRMRGGALNLGEEMLARQLMDIELNAKDGLLPSEEQLDEIDRVFSALEERVKAEI